MVSGVAVALPSLGADLGAGATALSLVETLFLASSVALLLPAGRLGDAADKVAIYKAGLAGFALTSIACGLVSSTAAILVLRFVQGIFGAMIQATGGAASDFASAGATYVIDILQWVPYIGLMTGAYDSVRLAPCGSSGRPSCHRGQFGVSVPFGIDYAFNRQFAAGFAGKYTLLLPGAGDGPGSYFTAFARAEFLWGY